MSPIVLKVALILMFGSYYALGFTYMIFGAYELATFTNHCPIDDQHVYNGESRHWIALGTMNLVQGFIMIFLSQFTRSGIQYIFGNLNRFSFTFDHKAIIFMYGPGFLVRIWTIILALLGDTCWHNMILHEIQLFYYHAAWLALMFIVWPYLWFHTMGEKKVFSQSV
jgi:hypothetical protein